MSTVPDPDVHFRQHEGDDMPPMTEAERRQWADEQLMAILGPPTFRDRMAYYGREALREVRNPELWVAATAVAAAILMGLI